MDKSDDTKVSSYKELERVLNQFPQYRAKTVLGDFSEEVGRKDMFVPALVNAAKAISVVNFANIQKSYSLEYYVPRPQHS
jgi:hypothetical protein